MKKTFVLFLCFFAALASAQEPDSLKEKRMQWFADAKLGIFIHWGIYAVDGIGSHGRSTTARSLTTIT